jgi:putative acetyltransferase
MHDVRSRPAGRDAEPAYVVTLARAEHVALLPAIELAAATLLAGHAPPSVLAETTSEAVLHDAQRRGHLWVALAHEVPVGFAHVTLLEWGAAHLTELDVHPAHGRRGLGRRLVETVCAWAGAAGMHAVTLTTFRDVPWNMPFYARLGFEEIPPRALGRALREILDEEARHGFDPARRVAMRRPVRDSMHVRPATPVDRAPLLEVWERAVRATHHFLGEDDVATLRPQVRQVLASDAVDWWVLDAGGRPAGFLGVAGTSIEALFVDPAYHGRGGGRLLVAHAQDLAGDVALTVEVNEHNEVARRFYERLGFVEAGRSPVDSEGRPFPILHLARVAPAARART